MDRSMDLQTRWLGLDLPHPFVAGAGPLSDDLDGVRRLEDAGAAAIVLRSLFEEQIEAEGEALARDVGAHVDSHVEAGSYLPISDGFVFGPESYLEHLWRVKQVVQIPVIASLNGMAPTAWVHYAGLIEEAGADALELNVYYLPTSAGEDGPAVELRTLEVLRLVKAATTLPVALKISPFFSSLPSFCRDAGRDGADGLVLFNRFLQPDIDIDTLETVPRLRLSTSHELLLRLRWLAILSGQLDTPLAVSGGVHGVGDAIKAVMAGAGVVQVVSLLLQRGPEELTVLRDGLAQWLAERGYEGLGQLRGSMDLSRCPDPSGFTRANYMRVLQGWRRAG